MSKDRNFFYIKIRVGTDKVVTNDEVEQIVQGLDYSIKSTTNGVKVTDTEICDSARDFTFSEEDDDEDE